MGQSGRSVRILAWLDQLLGNWPVTSVTGSAFVVLATLLVTLRFYRLNRALSAEGQARRRMQHQLRQSEEQYRRLVDNAPFPVVITGLEDARIRFMNPFAARKLAGKRSQLTGVLATDFYVRAEDRRKFSVQVAREGQVQAFETRLRTLDDRIFWADLSASQIIYEGEPCLFVVFVDVSARKQREADLEKLAHTDPLTGVWNRRKFNDLLKLECARTGRSRRSGSLLSLDIDNFKAINDTYGHPVGDEVLEQLAELMRQSLRLTDMIARTGGEEFAVILPDTDIEAAGTVAEKLRRNVEAYRFKTSAGMLRITVSIGRASIMPGATNAHVIDSADAALYQAKQFGRNRVALSRQPAATG